MVIQELDTNLPSAIEHVVHPGPSYHFQAFMRILT